MATATVERPRPPAQQQGTRIASQPVYHEAPAGSTTYGEHKAKDSTTADKVAAAVVSGSKTVVDLLHNGSEGAVFHINRAVTSHISATPPTSSAATVSPAWRTRVDVAARVTSFLAVASTQLASVTGSAMYALATLGVMAYKMLVGLSGGGSGRRPETFWLAQDQEVAVKVLGAALLVAYAMVYDAAEAAAARVFEAGKDALQHLVQHKYGGEASSLARDVLRVIESLAVALLAAWRVTFRAFVSNASKRSAAAYLAKHVSAAEGLKLE